jgi:hypothetical protein
VLGNFLICIALGGLIRIALGLSGQKWSKTFHVTSAILLLPVVSYTVSEFISGDIALSLGMVGALSIVRFRNPVKSPLELVVYFALITMGIGISVNSILSIYLGLVFSTVLILLSLLLNIGNNFGRRFFSSSFAEGYDIVYLEVTVAAPLKLEEIKSRFLHHTFNSELDGMYSYRLSFKDLQETNDFMDKISSHSKIENYSIIQN